MFNRYAVIDCRNIDVSTIFKSLLDNLPFGCNLHFIHKSSYKFAFALKELNLNNRGFAPTVNDNKEVSPEGVEPAHRKLFLLSIPTHL